MAFKIARIFRTIIVLASVVIVLSSLQSLLWPRVIQQAMALHELRSARQRAIIVEEQIDSIERINSEQIQGLQQLADIVPAHLSLPMLIERIERLADQHSLTATILSINDKIDSTVVAPLQPVIVSVQVFGTPSTLLMFLNNVEHLEEITAVTNINLVARTDNATNEQGLLAYTHIMTFDVAFFQLPVGNDDQFN